MTARVLVIGGYGNFGSFISRLLSRDENIQLFIAGRNEAKAQALAQSLDAGKTSETANLDITHGFEDALSTIKPNVVIYTSGPFQDQGYDVALACINQGCHYVDLADGRQFVTGVARHEYLRCLARKTSPIFANVWPRASCWARLASCLASLGSTPWAIFCADFLFQFPSLGKGNRGICSDRKQAFFATMAVFELPELRACGLHQDIKAFKVGSFLLLFSHFEVSNLNIA